MRGVFPDAVVDVRCGDAEFKATRAPVEETPELSMRGIRNASAGALRVIIGELPNPAPTTGTDIEVRDEITGEWTRQQITRTRPDELRATMRIEYGDIHGKSVTRRGI